MQQNKGMLGEIPTNVPSAVARDTKETLLTPGKNYGKDSYTIDLTGAEATYRMCTHPHMYPRSSTPLHVYSDMYVKHQVLLCVMKCETWSKTLK